MIRRTANLVLVVAAIFLAVSTSLAHAKLVSSTPSAGETLTTSPPSISLQFSVRVQSKMSSIAVKDASGVSIFVGAIVESDQGKLISVSLPELLPGSYRVEWRALSADDHIIDGNFEFTVGNESQAVQAGAADVDHGGMDHSDHQAAPSINWPQSLVRWLIYIGMMTLTGGLGFRLFVLGSAARSETLDARLMWIFAAAAFFTIAGLFAALVLQTQMLTGSFGISQGMSVLSETSFGPSWLLQLLTAIVAFVLLILSSIRKEAPRKVVLWFAFGLTLAALLGPSISGHARAAWDEYSLAIISDWLHLVAGSMWIGGLGVLAFAIASALGEADRQAAQESLSAITRRFTNIAIPATVLLAITGLYNTWIHVESPSALVGTTYGLVLVAKVAISGVMIVLGGINAFVLRPRLFAKSDAGADAGERRLFNSVRLEVLLAMIVLLLAAILAFLPPAREHKPISASETPAAQEAK
ncbi:MAG: CopD family protein [bacterium]|nr:CopD family protein [bacterium]